jgi:uncharacterized protein (DUF2235 family)
MSKRIVICADGTWNKPEQEHQGAPSSTNVAKLAALVEPRDLLGHEQVTYYHKGVGTGRGALRRLFEGAFGAGLSENIADCYLFIANNYRPGDELFLMGFSRGAYTVRSLAGLIRNSGILRQQHLGRYRQAYDLYRDRTRASLPRGVQATDFRERYAWPDCAIKFIGVWDTVGALGIPSPGLRLPVNSRYEFHDVELSTAVDHAYQALAIDEQRQPYLPTLWKKKSDAPATQVLVQQWFPGTHCDVGGGHAQTGLSDCGLRFMCDAAATVGLALDRERIPAGDPTDRIHPSESLLFRLLGDGRRTIGLSGADGFESVHASALARRQSVPSYRPSNLESFLARATVVPLTRSRFEQAPAPRETA